MASEQGVEWDREVDVVVVGSGTGQMAAIRAAENGLSALVLEKEAVLGGTTARSGGGIWAPNNYRMQEEGVPDSREEALEYMSRATFGQSEPELMEVYVDTVNEMVAYARKLGIEWMIIPGGAFPDYYESMSGAKTYGRPMLAVTAEGGGRSDEFGFGGPLVRALQKSGRERGVEYLTETPVKRPIVDDDGAVLGVVAESEGRELAIRARKGVVMATGGFSHNEAMVKAFLRGPVIHSIEAEGCTGDGQRMGMAIGADLRNMNESWGSPVFYDPKARTPILAIAPELGKPGCIVVNRKGKRFFDEAKAYHLVTRAFYHFDTDTLEYGNVPGFAIIDSGFRSRYNLAAHPPNIDFPSWISEADTIPELAGKLGIDPAGLEDTVARFNQFAETGADLDFHRGDTAFDKQTGGDPDRVELANICLGPISTPPLYGVAIWPSVLGTCGGLRINRNAQVLNVWGDVIPGLYAVGNASGSVMGAGYPGGGSTIGAGLTFSYIAANHIGRSPAA
jgi:succinate dehydrogenase/fumarate reductase flavoprotein subunit